ncbi:MAG: aminodeoxychorismate lyase [Gammaproteobacteria bacterium]|nr:aminodeoxychorismate lyase [Gammaproteobacteria bacterium]
MGALIPSHTKTLINGISEDVISFRDRGFQYGDGLFETLAVENGDVKNWELHWNRLCAGCERLFLPEPEKLLILSEIDHVVAGVGKEIVKIIISRGLGERGYGFKVVSPTRVVSAYQWPDLRKENATDGVELFVCETRIARQPALAGIKHLNRLENILARHEWQSGQYAEGIMQDTENNVIEGTMSNLFMVKNNKLQTPDLSYCGVEGVIRQKILKIARDEEIELEITNITLNELMQADEVFVCNSIIDIWPVNKIGQATFSVLSNQNKSSSITSFLQQNLVNQ